MEKAKEILEVKVIAAMEKQIEKLNHDGISEAATEQVCTALSTLVKVYDSIKA